MCRAARYCWQKVLDIVTRAGPRRNKNFQWAPLSAPKTLEEPLQTTVAYRHRSRSERADKRRRAPLEGDSDQILFHV